jgi:hypothetical protein
MIFATLSRGFFICQANSRRNRSAVIPHHRRRFPPPVNLTLQSGIVLITKPTEAQLQEKSLLIRPLKGA